jgi:hypothetical protein
MKNTIKEWSTKIRTEAKGKGFTAIIPICVRSYDADNVW